MAKKKKVSFKKEKVEIHRVAHYAFFVGLIIAIIAGFFRTYIGPEILVTTLVVLGTLVGLFNLTAKETVPFLTAAIALMLAGIVNLGLIPGIGLYLRAILSNIVVFANVVGLEEFIHSPWIIQPGDPCRSCKRGVTRCLSLFLDLG